nr:ArdC-like ssDNA-binding domain-containing protein [Methylorubrum populi]
MARRPSSSRKPSSARADTAPAPRVDLYQRITDTIVAQLEQGRVPWVQPWGDLPGTAAVGMPRNAATNRAYSGINVMLLWASGTALAYPTQRWLTFKQALGLGGCVRRGEKGTPVVYADRFTPEQERERAQQNGEEARSIAFLKQYTVFNAAQCDGLPEDLSSMHRVLRTFPSELKKHRWFQNANLNPERLPALYGIVCGGTGSPAGRYIDAVRFIEPRGLSDLVHRARRRVAAGGKLALDYPKLSILDTEHVRAVIAGTRDQPHILEPVANKEPCNVPLEGLPRPL